MTNRDSNRVLLVAVLGLFLMGVCVTGCGKNAANQELERKKLQLDAEKLQLENEKLREEIKQKKLENNINSLKF